jgi:hypothetical protein
MSDTAQEFFVQKFLNWEKVRERLDKYPNIRSQFPEKTINSCSHNSPYYCHYMAWRLGVWEGEDFFVYFDQLLENGISIKNWSSKKSQLHNCDFDDFWGLIWELQVADLFQKTWGTGMEWTTSGPDLKIFTEHGPFYVECYTYRKSFTLLEFIEELFTQIDYHLRVRHNLFLPVDLPKDTEEINSFLNSLFQMFLNPDFLAAKLVEAAREYPIPIKVDGYSGLRNVLLCVEGDNPKAYSPMKDPFIGTGDPEQYLCIALKEALNNKRKSNQIEKNRPNLLAVNYLLSPDYQTALGLRKINQHMLPDLGEEYDAVLFAAMGIDGRITANSSFVEMKENLSQSIKDLINKLVIHAIP